MKRAGNNPAAWAGPVVLLVSFGVYLSTIAPGVTFWDSGELIYGAYTLGLAHPPAYPLFCMVGKAFTLIPIGNFAYRVNLLSAVFGACTVYILYRLILELGEGVPGAWWLAAAGALSFAMYGSFWGVSVISEVYTINSVLLAAISLLMLRYDRSGREADLHASSFLLGLALSNHQSVLLFMPAYACYSLLRRKNYLRPGILVKSLFFFMLGYSVILYMPLRAAAGTVFNLGDPETLSNLGWSIKWPAYYKAAVNILREAPALFSGQRLPLVLGAAAALSALTYFARKRGYALMMFYASVTTYAGIAALTAGATLAKKWGLPNKFFIPSVFFMVPVAAETLFWAARRLGGQIQARMAFVAAAGILLTVTPVYFYALNLKGVDQSNNFFANDFGSNTLKSVKQDAAIFAWGDNGIFPVWYLQGCERYRDDVMFIHSELLTYDWYIDDLNARLRGKYGISFKPPFDVTDLPGNYPILRLLLERAAPTYLDYSAAQKLHVPYEKLFPQGLVHLTMSWNPLPLKSIWDKYTLRGVFDGSTNRAFAAEGILDIYAWESASWAIEANKEGRPAEALEAYGLAKKFGINNPALDKWAEEVTGLLRLP